MFPHTACIRSIALATTMMVGAAGISGLAQAQDENQDEPGAQAGEDQPGTVQNEAEVNDNEETSRDDDTTAQQEDMVELDVTIDIDGTVTEDGAIIIGGAPMYPDRTIVVNASTAENLSTLVSAVQAAELEATLESEGPFTVFAPTNDAFAMVPEDDLNALMEPDMQAQLAHVLTYHVVSGNYTAADLMARAQATDGSAELDTVSGDTLTLSLNAEGELVVSDEMGNAAVVQNADVTQSNGVVHVVDHVLMPQM